MKILYLTSFALPSPQSHRIQAVKTAEGMSYFADVHFVFNKLKGDIKRYYYLKKDFNLIALGYKGRLKSIVLAWKLRKLLKKIKPDFVYCCEHYLFFGVNILRKLGLLKNCPKMIFESHWAPENRPLIRLIDDFNIPKADFFVFTNRFIADYYVKRYGLNREKITVFPNGIDLGEFDFKIDKKKARGKFNLPLAKKLVGYLGRFTEQNMDRGIKEIFEAAAILKNKSYLFCFVGGGSKEEIEKYKLIARRKKVLESVKFIGEVEYNQVPFYLKAFDVLLMPFPKNRHFSFYMSPLKMFEYMASRRPIIASDLPSIREILGNDSCVFCQPGSGKDLAEKIKYVLEQGAEEEAEQAFEKVKNHTWREKGRVICSLWQA